MTASSAYSDFIEEAFVSPIRSVLIVDDDYPTLDEMLDSVTTAEGVAPAENQKRWRENPARYKSVIESFRKPSRPLLVDIHDGRNVGAEEDIAVAAHLHQSDLLVLDYELDRARRGDGSRSIEIIRSLTTNEHFNMVILHTTEGLEVVFRNIIVGLLSPSFESISDEDRSIAEELINEAEDLVEGFEARLTQSVGEEQYLHWYLHQDTYLRTMGLAQQPYTAFAEQCEAAGWQHTQPRLILKYLLLAQEQRFAPRMMASNSPELKWSLSGTKWIRSDSVFIAFSQKPDQDDLIGSLLQALNAWRPQPSRLFLTILRAKMDEHGIVAQSKVLEKRHALAHWYSRLLAASGSDRRAQIAETVSRHSDQLMRNILPDVEDFAVRLVNSEVANGDINEICQAHFKVDLNKPAAKLKAERQHNALVCSMEPKGWHLSTGHIFKMEDDYWVCLTPACDMVPRRSSADFGNRMPFLAVKLHPIKDAMSPDVNSNMYIFLQFGDEVKGFCFNHNGREGHAPAHRNFYAEKNGLLDDGCSFKASSIGSGVTRLIAVKRSGVVVAQLRYEYALNLMQRLGVSMTRIGLDFVGSPDGEPV